MNVRTMLLQAAERNPDYIAMVEAGQRLSYADWAVQVSRIADALVARGIGHGDRVAISMRNSIDFATCLFATQMLGAVAVPFNFRLKAKTIDFMLSDSGAVALITDDTVDPVELHAATENRPGLLRVKTGALPESGEIGLEELHQAGRDVVHNIVGDDDLSMIVYTSGTTGRPKGVPLSQRNNYGRMASYIMSTGPHFDSATRTLGAAPLYHTVGIHWVLLLTVLVNGTYYPVTRIDESTPAFIESEKISFIFGSPTMLKQTVTAAAKPMTDVRYVSYGSAPTEQQLLDDICAYFPGAMVCEVYGTTEISIPFVTRDMRGRKPGTLRPTGDHRIRLVSPGAAPDRLADIGQDGELIVHMSNAGIFQQYWGEDGAGKTAAKLKDGWFYTGDVFHIDDEGNYYFHGRRDDMFISGGENIQPAEVENTLNDHASVRDAAVIGTPDAKWGNVVTAFVVSDGDEVTPQELDEFCRKSALENYKRPRKYIFLDSIPRNPSGKIVRADLVALAADLETSAEGGDPAT